MLLLLFTFTFLHNCQFLLELVTDAIAAFHFHFSTKLPNFVAAGDWCYPWWECGREDIQRRGRLFLLQHGQNICHCEFVNYLSLWYSYEVIFLQVLPWPLIYKHNFVLTSTFATRPEKEGAISSLSSISTIIIFVIIIFYLFLNQASKGGSNANNLGTIIGDSNADGTNAGIKTILTVSKVGFT